MKKLILLKYFIVITLLWQTATAQICTGSLGDAVVNVTFGAGANPGNALPQNTTTYQYILNDCPIDGSYTIINNTQNCFGNSWQTLTEDHTPNDANGYMMLVNASITPGDFFIDTVQGLCANTTYEFGAWITNVLLPTSCSPNPIHPALKFTIETTNGAILGTYLTGNIFETDRPVWKQYGLFFTTPANINTVVIRLTNNAPGGCGNDLALDDITFKPCGPTITAGSLSTNLANIDVCNTNALPIPLSASIGNGFTTNAVQWQQSVNNGQTWIDIPGATTTNYTFTSNTIGTYLYRLTAAEGNNILINNCRVASNIITITVHGQPSINISGVDTTCEQKTIALTATGANTYNWIGPANFTWSQASFSITAQSNFAGVYTVTGTDIYGCINTTNHIVTVKPVPTAILNSPVNICKGDSIQLQVLGGVMPNWLPVIGLSAYNIANPIAKPLTTTTYFVTVSGTNGCLAMDSVVINVLQKPVLSAGPDKVIIKGQSVALDGSIEGNTISYYWLPTTNLNNALLLQPISSTTQNITYFLYANSTIGCGNAVDTMHIKVYDDIYIPNAFTPNDDVKNKTWNIAALAAYPDARLMVYNRFGQNIFASKSNTVAWDGTYKGLPVPAGVYVYVIDFKNKRPTIKGTVTVIR
jgi:gliding motility-associated-like protein